MHVGPLQTIYASSQSGKTTAIAGMTYIGTIKDTFGAKGVLLKFYNSSVSATGILSVTTTPAWGEAIASTASFPPAFAVTTATGGTNPNWAQAKANAAIFMVTPTIISSGVSAQGRDFGFLTPFIHVSASSTVSAITASAGGGAGPICEAFVLYDEPGTLEASNNRGLF